MTVLGWAIWMAAVLGLCLGAAVVSVRANQRDRAQLTVYLLAAYVAVGAMGFSIAFGSAVEGIFAVVASLILIAPTTAVMVRR